MAQELFELLQADHDKVKSIIDDLSETSSNAQKTRESSFKKLKDELIPHMRAEEQAFYPALEQYEEAREVALEALEEHHVAEAVLNELSSMDMTDERWSAKLKVFQELIEHHIEEEESEVFDAAEESFDEEQMEEITKQVKSIKQEIKAGVT
ncbi:MAG: hemerythrin domain-containing protein [Armatimonadota bacterium]